MADTLQPLQWSEETRDSEEWDILLLSLWVDDFTDSLILPCTHISREGPWTVFQVRLIYRREEYQRQQDQQWL